MKKTSALLAILDERIKQEKQWGRQNHDPLFWLAILVEEVGELSTEVLHVNLSEMRKEAVQVAAVSLAFIESLDRQQRIT